MHKGGSLARDLCVSTGICSGMGCKHWQSFNKMDSVEFVDYFYQSMTDGYYVHSSPLGHMKG